MHNEQANKKVREKQRPNYLVGEARRNFVLCALNGALFQFANGLIEPSIVLTTWFVGRLTSSNLLLALVVPLGQAGWFLPQLFVSAHIQRMQRKMPVYAISAVTRVIVWSSLSVMVWLVDEPTYLLVGFFTLYAIAQMAAGPAGLAFFDIVAKTVPARRRGRLFATRMFVGGILAMGASWIVNRVLGHPALPVPHDIALLLTIYSVMLIPSFSLFFAVREPPGVTTDKPVGIKKQLRRAGQLLRKNPIYRRYTAVRLILGLTGVALPFYSVYAKNVLGAEAGMAGIYAAVAGGAKVLSNIAWGWVSDQKGNRLVMRLLIGGKGLALLLALALVGSVSLLKLEGAWLPYLALPLFFLDGATFPAGILAGSNFLTELVSDAERPIYLGLTNTLSGIVTLLSVLGGLLVDWLGFAGLFATALVLCVVGLALSAGLPEPRETAT
jgi:MFS family permease